MGDHALVESLVTDSIELLRQLDSEGYGPSSALWQYYADAGQWKLVLAGKALDGRLPKEEPLAYKEIAERIRARGLGSLTIGDVKIVRTDSPLIQALRPLLRTPPNGIVRAHFTNTTLNGIFIEEMIMLRSS